MISYSTHATDIVGYTFAADNYHPECLHLPTGEGEAYDGWAPCVPMTVEASLSGIAYAFGINRADEGSFDSADFPKVIFASMVETDEETCGGCGRALLEGA